MRFRALTFTCTMTLVGAGALVGLAVPSGAQEVTAADCGSKTYRWLFFPEGHGTLKGVPHPATDVPHVDVYSGKGKKFTEAQNVAYADGTAASTTAVCTPAQPSGSGSASVKSTTAAKQLVCTSKSNPVFIVIPESTVDLPSLSATVDGSLEVHAQMGSAADVASTLDYDGKLCKLTKLPK
jgi:hypothetical protein